MIPYEYIDKENDGSFYKVKVINKQKGERYTSQLLAAEVGEAKVYPTAASTTISIALDKQYNNASYKIYSVDGRVVVSGTLENIVNTVPIGNLSSGSYLVSVQAANKRTVSHLQKI
ncbi:MAG: T9SS type A sorting domain-containing protein [Bacteroidetes bacterium]|nr:T9SS type A sorting domain-containing protein [Bacteroidota bacterium]